MITYADLPDSIKALKVEDILIVNQKEKEKGDSNEGAHKKEG